MKNKCFLGIKDYKKHLVIQYCFMRLSSDCPFDQGMLFNVAAETQTCISEKPKEALHRLRKHRKAIFSHHNSAVYLHLKVKVMCLHIPKQGSTRSTTSLLPHSKSCPSPVPGGLTTVHIWPHVTSATKAIYTWPQLAPTTITAPTAEPGALMTHVVSMTLITTPKKG